MGANLGVRDVDLTQRHRLAETGPLTLHASMNQKCGKTLQKAAAERDRAAIENLQILHCGERAGRGRIRETD